MAERSIEKMETTIKDIKEEQKETDRLLTKIALEADRRSKEADKRFKETDNLLKQIASEADRRFKEADKRFKETEQVIAASQLKTDEYLRKSEGKFTSRWGRLIEALVSGQLVNLLRERGIDASNIYERHRGRWQNKQYEIDITVKNGSDIVIVEVKTTLLVEDVQDFLYIAQNYRQMNSDVKDKNIYAAVAYLHADESSDIYAQKKGLFVIKATGSSASIINKETFKPRNF